MLAASLGSMRRAIVPVGLFGELLQHSGRMWHVLPLSRLHAHVAVVSMCRAGCMGSLQDCVNKTIARIKSKLEKEDKRVLNHVVYGLRSTRK